MLNRLYNCKNPYQGDVRKVLCVCSAGLLRSPTMAVVLQEKYGYNTRAAGTDEDHALIPVDKVLVHWADEIVCAEERHANQLVKMFGPLAESKLVVLRLPDMFGYMDETLQRMILKQYEDTKQEIKRSKTSSKSS